MHRMVVIAAAAYAMWACGDGVDALAPADFVGVYSLRTVNGFPVPQEVGAASGCTRSFEWGWLTLAESGFQMSLTGRWGGCAGPGLNVIYGPQQSGGGVTIAEHTLVLHMVSAGNPGVTTVEATVSGSAIELTLPPGSMNVAVTTTLGFTRDE